MGVCNKFDTHIGVQLRKARQAHELTQDGLAQLVGISFQQIQKYENGTNRVSMSRAWALSQALALPITYFFEGLADDEADQDVVEALPNRIMRGASDLDALPDGKLKDQVLGLISVLKAAA